MFESVVARILNQLLGKYVVDLDTENLNVGIFSGNVQLSDLRLKSEALYELKLPIKVKLGTIGKVWLKIPWNYLWNEPIVINIEDIHIVAEPILQFDTYDADIDKRLIRALKRKILSELDKEKEFIGGPLSFSEHLVTYLINNLQLSVANVHIRYEDYVSTKSPVACGLCIGSITAETTNSKWKACKVTKSTDCYYLIKVEAFSVYWNSASNMPEQWDMPRQYYCWRNTMSNSLQNFCMNNQEFKFVIKPMTAKVKMTISKSNDEIIDKILSDVLIQDCNIQVSHKQYQSFLAVSDSLSRMFISWNFLSFRPTCKPRENKSAWWKYAIQATLEQRVKPYTWVKIKKVREEFRLYTEAYKKILLNPNNTELKMDLQKYEDCLSVINIVIARRRASLLLKAKNGSIDKSFWSMLPSPERTLLCDKIGYCQQSGPKTRTSISHQYNFCVGNISVALVSSSREIVVLTMTQLISTLLPNFSDDLYKITLKLEGIIVEGTSPKDVLIPIVSSEHYPDSPAFVLKFELEKVPTKSGDSFRVSGCLAGIEVFYNHYTFAELQKFFKNEWFSTRQVYENVARLPTRIFENMCDKILQRWSFNLDIKIPHIVIPDIGSLKRDENIIIIDPGQLIIKTDLCGRMDIFDIITQMELEENYYSRLHIECKDTQIMFCDVNEAWHDARKEKDTDIHILSKTTTSAVFSICQNCIETLPKYKLNTSVPTLKINFSERKIVSLLKFLNAMFSKDNNAILVNAMSIPKLRNNVVTGRLSLKYLYHVRHSVHIPGGRIKFRKFSSEKQNPDTHQQRNPIDAQFRQNMNEVWARVVDLPGLEDNISPYNNIYFLMRLAINEFILTFSRSSDKTDRAYLMFRISTFTLDVATMTYGPAYQLSLNSILLTDKLYTSPSGQYLDLVHSPFPTGVDAFTLLYRKVNAKCPDFWTHFHGVETSLVANIGTLNLLLHQDAIHTIVKYTRYMYHKICTKISAPVMQRFAHVVNVLKKMFQSTIPETPIPPGAVKYSQSIHLANLKIRVCDSDFDIINVVLSGLEMDFLFRANERFVFRSFLSGLTIEHLSEITLYTKVMTADEDKVYEIKYVRNAPHLIQKRREVFGDPMCKDSPPSEGSFKFQLGQIHITFLYKLFVQLQRFVVNLEMVPLIQKTVAKFEQVLTRATDTLKSCTKINLSINIHGPILLFPQRSDSPNVVIFNTGLLNVENYFKVYGEDIIENILIKLNGIMISRGIMGITSNLEMQETMIEPLSMHVDVKRYQQMSWEIDGFMEVIQITLGQRDLSLIFSIYIDNIGEGKLIDWIPDTIRSPIQYKTVDNTVRTLEAFLSEPKQKYLALKFSIEAIKLMLFFDSGELLSSPIRDLNHGLCKLEAVDIITSLVIYSDHSIDGKLSIDGVIIEELGLENNVYDKGILHSPLDDSKNNNCNITINKPPIIDVTFHRTKWLDASVDIIFGRLSLCLSVPLCEKLATFILECLPKDNTDLGIVNHGYIAEIGEIIKSERRRQSMTVAVRINKPEFIFIVETTSNKKRYFVTKAEILIDYSQNASGSNSTLSLSGFHNVFYDMGVSSSAPFAVLKRCDVEFSKTSNNKEERMILSVSVVCVQICSRVVHALLDILHDIIEHFKLPETALEDIKRTNSKSDKNLDYIDLWEPKKLPNFVPSSDDEYIESKVSPKDKAHEVFLLMKTDVILILELDNRPVFVAKSTTEITVHNWTSLLNSVCEINIQANYYNESLQTWEPVIDPVVTDENQYTPWNILMRVFQDKSVPILNISDNKIRKESDAMKRVSVSPSSSDDEYQTDMMYLEPPKLFNKLTNRCVKTNLSAFLEESDSENDEGTMEKLAHAISDLFTGDWNESIESDYGHSSEADEDESENNLDSKEHSEHSAPVLPKHFKKSMYFIIDTKETLNITITPALLKLVNNIITVYSNKTLSILSNIKSISLINDIGPKSVIELYEAKGHESIEDDELIQRKMYENEDSCPNSPTKMSYLHPDSGDEFNFEDDSDAEEIAKLESDLSCDYEITENLKFPICTTSGLYEKIHKHYLKILIPGFLPQRTNCPKRSWQKLIRLQTNTNKQIYYVTAKHSLDKCGRTFSISSPLQIKNETCFALSILYQPSVLQQLNLEPVGDVRNPFETTMRIAVLEPQEHYNIPLYIAYHCKLFIEPTYAEGHYMPHEGLWWKSLATELDVQHYIMCTPKANSNLEVFTLKVLMRRNISAHNNSPYSIPNYVIHLLPSITLQNFLPYTLEVQNMELKQHIKVEPGETSSIYSINLNKDQKFMLKVSYIGYVWCGTLNFTSELDEKLVFLVTDSKTDGANKQLPINVKTERDENNRLLFFASYWIVNNTELPLQFKVTSSNSIFESSSDDVILFTFKRNTKQSIALKVYESSWSSEFTLDSAGTTGLVVCKDHERKKRYSFLLSIRPSLMCPQYTKIVTLLPSFLVINKTTKSLRFMEHNEKTDLWIDLLPDQCKIFWPETSSMEMYVKYKSSKFTSAAFLTSINHCTVLRMDKGSAISVDVTGGAVEPFHITFSDYKIGDAPLLIKNMCSDIFLKVQQQGQNPVTLLNPYVSLLYTWDDPLKPRQFIWNVYNNKGPGFFIDILKDGYGEERINCHSVPPRSLSTNNIANESSSSEDSDTVDSVKTTFHRKVRRDKLVIYWICYNEGLQKVLLFTQEQRIFNHIIRTSYTRLCDYEWLLSMSGIGVSIFTKPNLKKEHIYFSITDTPATWEVNVGHKWKVLTLELASWIEDKYKLPSKKCQLKDYIHIDFDKMFMLKPFFAELRRTYSAALYVLVRKSRDHQYINCTINSIQIDNKQASDDDSIILHPFPSINIKTPTPFIEFIALKVVHKDCGVYKHIHLNVENFHLHIDSHFVMQIASLYTNSLKMKSDTVSLYRSEMAMIHSSLITINKDKMKGVVNNRIENFHMSQIHMQLKMSSSRYTNLKDTSVTLNNFLNYIYPRNMSAYMPAEGVLLRIIPFEVVDTKKSICEILIDACHHLKSQFLQQYYSQVLGLQVLVNGFAKQIIPSNEYVPSESDKMACALLSGYRCLLGQINMSTAALEQCVNEMFTNQSVENIQRILKRLSLSYYPRSSLPTSITISSRNFTTGAILALGQLITKRTHNGMLYDAEVFFRGTGKALFSLVMQHANDDSDDVQIAIEALRRATILGEPVRIHQRLTRYNNHMGLKPMSLYNSMGNYLLETIAGGKFVDDIYWSHAAVDNIGKSIILVSLQHVIRINKYRLWGQWELEWSLEIDDVISVPHMESDDLILNVRQGEENKFVNTDGNLSISGDKATLVWLKDKLEQAIIISMEDKSWSIEN